MFLIFTFGFVGNLVAALYSQTQSGSPSQLRSFLAGPLYLLMLALVSGIAAWAIWKAHASARTWAIGASLLYLTIFLRPLVFSVRPARDHYLFSLLIGLIGLAAFAWPD